MKISQLINPPVVDEEPAEVVGETVASSVLEKAVENEDQSVVVERVETSKPVVKSLLNIYGHDMTDPKHSNFASELELMKDTDPALYHKIVTLH